jgi:CheY-like chemotaxis protein
MSTAKTILVADDFVERTEVLTIFIQSLGCIAVTAFNGAEAVEQATAARARILS